MPDSNHPDPSNDPSVDSSIDPSIDSSIDPSIDPSIDSSIDPSVDPANETKQEARKHPRSLTAVGESEEWLFTALQSIGDAVIATDAVGRIVFMNTVAVTLTGWSAEEAQGRDSSEVFHIVNESTRLLTESPVTKVIRDGVISGLANHTILIARDGVEHNIDDSGSPIHDKNGNLSGVVLIFRDITERRKSEQTRQEQQGILQTLFDHIPVIITFLDENHQFKWVNREWMRIVGWSLAEMHAPERVNAFQPALQPALQPDLQPGVQPGVQPALLAPPLASDFPSSLASDLSPEFTPEFKPEFDPASDPAFDPAFNATFNATEQLGLNGKTQDHNSAGRVEQDTSGVIPNVFPTRLPAIIPSGGTLESEVPNWRDIAISVKDGRILYLSWSTVQLSNGTSIGIGKDITERKHLEALTAKHTTMVETRNRRLEQAMRETDHRVKNNLQLVAALLDIQVTTHEQTVPIEELTQVRMHIFTLASIHDMLVQDVREEGAIGKDGAGNSVRLISARESLKRLMPMLQKLVGEQRISWNVADIHLPVKQGMSLAVLINELVNNAVKHGGHTVDLRLAVQKQDITLEVSDDGPGFTQEFSPLTSANFGLELVESIGRLDLGGKTTYENRPEGGARVRVTFPMPPIPGVAQAS